MKRSVLQWARHDSLKLRRERAAAYRRFKRRGISTNLKLWKELYLRHPLGVPRIGRRRLATQN